MAESISTLPSGLAQAEATIPPITFPEGWELLLQQMKSLLGLAAPPGEDEDSGWPGVSI